MKSPIEPADEAGGPTFVYVMACGEHTKIGVAGNPTKRLRILQATCPLPITLVSSLQFPDFATARRIEAEFHNIFVEFRGFGEWFHMPAAWAHNALTQKIDQAAVSIEVAYAQLGEKSYAPRKRWKRHPELWVTDEEEPG